MKILCAKKKLLSASCFYNSPDKKIYIVEELLKPELLNGTNNFYILKNNYKIKKGFIIPKGSNLLGWNGYSFGLNINGEVSVVIPIIEEYGENDKSYNYILCLPRECLK